MILSSGPQWLPSLIATVAYGIVAAAPDTASQRLRGAVVVAWLAHGAAIIVDVAGIGSDAVGARFGFAPALSATIWLVVGVYGVESRFIPLPGARRVLALTAIVALIVALAFPGEFHPQVAFAWSPLHWVLGIVCYGLFGTAVLHALLLDARERRLRSSTISGDGGGVPLLRLERLTFRFVAAGFVVLSAAIVLGALNAPAWRWDHKTVFSILGWVTFGALLAGRQAFGWRGRRATRWLYVGAALLLLAYVGSRFVFEVVLGRSATS